MRRGRWCSRRSPIRSTLVHFWGPHGATNPVCEMDVRPGGLWRQVMRFPDGSEYGHDSLYLEVVEPERLVYRDVPRGSDGYWSDCRRRKW